MLHLGISRVNEHLW